MNPTDLRKDFEDILIDVGVATTFKSAGVRSYSGTDYDEVFLSGATITSGLGIKQPVSLSDEGDVLFLEQGKIELSDDKLFVHGSIALDPETIINYGGSLFEVTKGSISSHDVAGTTVYKRIYIRPLYRSGAWYG